MYVYPRQVDTARIQMICRAVSGMVLSRNRLYEDPFEFPVSAITGKKTR